MPQGFTPIVTNYQRGYENMGKTISQGVSELGKTASTAFTAWETEKDAKRKQALFIKARDAQINEMEEDYADMPTKVWTGLKNKMSQANSPEKFAPILETAKYIKDAKRDFGDFANLPIQNSFMGIDKYGKDLYDSTKSVTDSQAENLKNESYASLVAQAQAEGKKSKEEIQNFVFQSGTKVHGKDVSEELARRDPFALGEKDLHSMEMAKGELDVKRKNAETKANAEKRMKGAAKAKENTVYKELGNKIFKLKMDWQGTMILPESNKQQIKEYVTKQMVIEVAAGMGLNNIDDKTVGAIWRDINANNTETKNNPEIMMATMDRMEEIDEATQKIIDSIKSPSENTRGGNLETAMEAGQTATNTVTGKLEERGFTPEASQYMVDQKKDPMGILN